MSTPADINAISIVNSGMSRSQTKPAVPAASGITANTSRQPERKRVRVADLVANSEQGAVYDDLPPGEFKQLLEDVRQRGLDHPLDVFSPTTRFGRDSYELLDGHQRKKVLELLGIDEVDVIIRHDLANASPAEKQIAFISANLVRRQLDRVGKVRAAIRRYEWQTAGGRRLTSSQLQKARDPIGEMVGVSGRTVSRYLRLARAPLAIQRAVSRKLLPLVVGEKVADLKPTQQTAIADKISQAKTAKQVKGIMNEHGLSRESRHKKTSDALASFVRALEVGLHDLDGRLQQVSAAHAKAYAPTLTKASESIAELLRIAAIEPTVQDRATAAGSDADLASSSPDNVTV